MYTITLIPWRLPLYGLIYLLSYLQHTEMTFGRLQVHARRFIRVSGEKCWLILSQYFTQIYLSFGVGMQRNPLLYTQTFKLGNKTAACNPRWRHHALLLVSGGRATFNHNVAGFTENSRFKNTHDLANNN